jgi:MFS family permease
VIEGSQLQGRRRSWKLASAMGRPIVVLLLLQLMGGMMFSPQRTFYPVYVKGLGYSAVMIATIATVNQAMGLIASLVGGALSDGLGRKWTLLLGNVGFVLGAAIFVTASPGWIGLLWALTGFSMGLHTLGGQSYLMDNAAPHYLGLLAAFFNWGYTLGGTLSSPAAGFLLERWDYGTFGTALAIFALGTVSVNVFALPSSPADARRQPASWKRLFGYGEIAARPTVVVLVLLRFLPTVYWGMALLLIPLLLDAAGATKMAIAWYATVSQLTASVAQLIVGQATDRLGPKVPTVIVYSALVLSVLATGLLPDQVWGVFLFGTLGTAAAWSLSTLLPSWVAQVTVSQERGRVLGWIHLWWNLAMIVGSMVGGALYERWAGVPFLLAGALNVFSIALAFVFFQMVRRARGAR